MVRRCESFRFQLHRGSSCEYYDDDDDALSDVQEGAPAAAVGGGRRSSQPTAAGGGGGGGAGKDDEILKAVGGLGETLQAVLKRVDGLQGRVDGVAAEVADLRTANANASP